MIFKFHPKAPSAIASEDRRTIDSKDGAPIFLGCATVTKSDSFQIIILIGLVFNIILLLAGCASGPKVGSFNFKPVTPGLWRSGQPQTEADIVTIEASGIRVIVKLNEERLDWESDMCRKHGMALVYLPITLQEQLFGVPGWKLAAIKDAVRADGCLVHCEHGQDRTGLAVGMFRLGQGAPAKAAYQEMLANGFHPALKGLQDAWEGQVKGTFNAQHSTSNIEPPKSKIQLPIINGQEAAVVAPPGCQIVTNRFNGRISTWCRQYHVVEWHFQGYLGPHQSAYHIEGPWSIPASNTYVWRYTDPLCNSRGEMIPAMFFKGAFYRLEWWTNQPADHVSYATAN